MWKTILPHSNSKYADKSAQMAACLPRRDRAEFKTQHHKSGGGASPTLQCCCDSQREVATKQTIIEQPDKAPDVSQS